MWHIDKLVKIGTRELAKNFDADIVGVILELDTEPHHWMRLNCTEYGDLPFNFYIVEKLCFSEGGLSEYTGKVLVREGKVLYYDRHPVSGGPFQVKDFKIPGFRKRAELIVQNIDSLLGYDGESALTSSTSEALGQLPEA